MNPMKDLIEDVKSLSQEQLLLRCAIVLSLLGYALVLLVAGESSIYALIVLTILSVCCVLNPHTVIPAAVMVWRPGGPGWRSR